MKTEVCEEATAVSSETSEWRRRTCGNIRFDRCEQPWQISSNEATGAGIDSERLDKIFEKLETDQQPEKRSVGLGLAIVKQIVELHGGTIAVESRVGEGSTFAFEVPQRVS